MRGPIGSSRTTTTKQRPARQLNARFVRAKISNSAQVVGGKAGRHTVRRRRYLIATLMVRECASVPLVERAVEMPAIRERPRDSALRGGAVPAPSTGQGLLDFAAHTAYELFPARARLAGSSRFVPRRRLTIVRRSESICLARQSGPQEAFPGNARGHVNSRTRFSFLFILRSMPVISAGYYGARQTRAVLRERVLRLPYFQGVAGRLL